MCHEASTNFGRFPLLWLRDLRNTVVIVLVRGGQCLYNLREVGLRVVRVRPFFMRT
jgi:hypothetical protein